MYLGTVRNGHIEYRPTSMQKEYARVGEDGVEYHGPASAEQAVYAPVKIAVFGPNAEKAVLSPAVQSALAAQGKRVELVAVTSEMPWGKASQALVSAVYDQHVSGIIALDRASSHLAEQIGVKALLPVIAISSDRTLTSINIPWIFRLPEGSQLQQAVRMFADAAKQGNSPTDIRAQLASGREIAGVRFDSTGEAK
jgi:ABC-type branched-subunit amino acid transport system substrate-binding protein